MQKVLLILIISCSSSLHAYSEFIPALTVKEYLATNTTSTLDESGQVTTFTPGFRYKNTGRRSQLDVDYGYNAVLYNGLSNEDTEYHSLSLLYGFTHIPEHWVTQISGNLSQSSISSDGIQSFNTVLDSANTRQLRTYGINTAINTILKQTVNLKTQLLADYADFEGSDNTDSIGLNLALDNQVSQKKLFWNTALSARQTSSGSNTEQLNTLLLGLNYRFNSKYSGYVNSQAYDTSNTALNETSAKLGFMWHPDSNSTINAAIGVRGSDTQYSLNTTFIRKRLTLSINYNEDITSARNEVLQQTTDQVGITNTFQSLSITPVFQKKADINLTLNGRRSDVTISYSTQTRTTRNLASRDEQIDALSLSVSRRLSEKSSTAFRYQLQKTGGRQENDVTFVQLTYNRTISKNINMIAELTSSKQQSDLVTNEYEQQLIGITLKATF